MGTKFLPLFRCITSKRLVLFSVALLAMGIMATSASAQSCLIESSGIKNPQCTSNDVRIASITAVHNLDGSVLSTCNIGVRYTFVMTASLVVGSTSSRSNVGLYFAEDNQAGDGGKNGGGALTGACWRDVIPPVDFSANAFCTAPGVPFAYCTGSGTGSSTQTLGSDHPTELDGGTDNCGDGNAGQSQTVNILAENIICEPDATNHLRLPSCISWQIPGGTIQCSTSAPTYDWVAAAIPPNPSKCNCSVLSVPVIVQHASISVTKSATATTPTGADGSPVNYSTTVKNTSNLGGVTINQLCDDQYGNIATATTNPAQQACAAPALCSTLCTGSGTPFSACTGNKTGNFPAGSTCATNVSCTPTIPASLAAPNDSVTCTFTGQIPENSTITDKVTANGVDSNIPPTALSGNASASASATDAPSAATLTKTVGSAQTGCATLRFTAKIANSSGLTTDETENLWALSDTPFGDLTTVHGDTHTNDSVVGTTCGQGTPNTNGGTLASTAGAGTFPATIAVGGNYTCQFDGVVCGTLTTITKPDNSTCQGLQQTDHLVPTLVSDEGTCSGSPLTCTDPVRPASITGGSLTVSECFDTFSQ